MNAKPKQLKKINDQPFKSNVVNNYLNENSQEYMTHTQPRHTKGIKSNVIPENFQTLHNPISDRMNS